MQTVIGFLRRQQPDGSPCFALNQRLAVVSARRRRADPVLQRMFAGGYTYDPKRNYYGTTYPHIRPPFKDGWYEHSADALSYAVTAFCPPDPAALVGAVRNPAAERRAQQLLRDWGENVNDERQVSALAAEIVQARQKKEQRQAEFRALRSAQKDVDEYDLVRQGRRRERGGAVRVTRRGSRRGIL